MDKKTVLITGISRGIGKATALKFAEKGWNVCGCYKKNKPDFSIENALFFQADISDHAQAKELVQKAYGAFGRIDSLINNAAITADKTIFKMTPEMWQAVLATNLNGTFYMLKEVLAVMMKQKSGAIINIASKTAFTSPSGTANYSASKAGVISLTKTAAREAGRFGITVNAVLPGFHQTDMGNTAGKDYIEKAKEESVLNTTTDIKELVDFIVFLANLKTVSGQTFNMDSRIL